MNITRFNPATGTLFSALLTEALSVEFDYAYPLYYALGVLTGYPGYPALPVVVTACNAGLTLSTLTGYYVGGYVPLTAGLTLNAVAGSGPGPRPNAPADPGPENYYAALGLLRALPTRLTYAALAALGVDFSLSGIVNGPVPAGAALVGAGLTPFTKTDWYGLGGASAAPNGSAPLITDLPNATTYPATVIADAVGVSVLFYLTTDGDTAEFNLSLTPNGEPDNAAYAVAVAVAGGLPATAALSPAYLTGLGFTAVGPSVPPGFSAEFNASALTPVPGA